MEVFSVFILYANKNQLSVRAREPVTSGSVNACEVRFEFTKDWDGLERTAVFRCGAESRSVLLGAGDTCTVPWEVLAAPGRQLAAGVYGTRGGELVLPTVWAWLGMVLEGAAPGESARPPVPELWEQALAQKGGGLALDGLELKLMSGERTLSQVKLPASGAGEEADHRYLSGRNAENQHPISAVSGLEEALAAIPVPMTADQLRKILNDGGN